MTGVGFDHSQISRLLAKSLIPDHFFNETNSIKSEQILRIQAYHYSNIVTGTAHFRLKLQVIRNSTEPASVLTRVASVRERFVEKFKVFTWKSLHKQTKMEYEATVAYNVTGSLESAATSQTSYAGLDIHDKMMSDFQHLFHVGEGVFITALLSLLCLFGLVANWITFSVIATSKTLRRNPFNILILSLSISDFFSALNSPLQIYRSLWGYLEFNLPVGVCKFTVGLNQLTMFVTVQHIMVFSVLRVFAILSPHKVKKNFSPKGAKIVACVIWVEVFFAYALFYIITATVVPYSPGRYKTACTAVSKEWRAVGTNYVAVALPIMLFAPFAGILLCAIIFCVTLVRMRFKRAKGSVVDSTMKYTSTTDSEAFSDYKELEDSEHITREQLKEQENAALVQVSLIVFSFVFGYSIDAAYRMTKALDMRHLFTQRTKWLTVTVSYVCLRISECLNPLFYNLASSHMRESTKRFLRIGAKASSTPTQDSKPVDSTKM